MKHAYSSDNFSISIETENEFVDFIYFFSAKYNKDLIEDKLHNQSLTPVIKTKPLKI